MNTKKNLANLFASLKILKGTDETHTVKWGVTE